MLIHREESGKTVVFFVTALEPATIDTGLRYVWGDARLRPMLIFLMR
ncbi:MULTISPECIES: hypothetical protein [Catenuloplanes]|uniref:Uncharacterized protein n=1 Tax=Catenuloplanes niger TaxID=587534 RepID=A0AAE3ZWS4_9ACTN|nr:hypothetical protein [Catenuloplanes niger]MDR7327499.1 hypothetical protein [Catenuloplanes niger]